MSAVTYACCFSDSAHPTGQPTVILPPTPEKIPSQKVILPNQSTPQKIVPCPVNTPRKIAPHTMASNISGKPKVKYYAANASTLPINVVQQLIATRGAKLSQGAFSNQSILLIPMENEGQTRNVVSSASVTPVKTQLSPTATTPDIKTVKSENTPSPGSTCASAVKTSPNTLILPKPLTSPVLSLGQGLPNLQIQPGFAGLQRPQTFLQPALVDGLNVTRLVHVGISPKSPTRYPTNETVKTLLEKRKPLVDEKEPFVLEKKKAIVGCVNKSSTSVNSCSSLSAASDQLPVTLYQTSHSPSRISPVNATQNLIKVENNIEPGQVNSAIASVANVQPTLMSMDPAKKEALISAVKAQQCVITSISAAKLNTLLLQTTAAGAKSIPSLINLPSKAALDLAVKAVVTSVNVTLPTVNIKVPSPTSLPSIGPRRNVTKTIQTMKSPISVAPKVVTETYSGHTTLSCADLHSSASSPMFAAACPVQGLSTSSNALSVTQSPVLTTCPVQGLSIPTNALPVTQSQMLTGTQDEDGKKVLSRLAPQLVLTPKGVMQMGYVSPGQLTCSATSVAQVGAASTGPGGNQAMLIQNSAGQYQLIQQPSPVIQQSTQGNCLQQLANQSVSPSPGQNLLQSIKPVVALNASGNPIILPTVKPNTQLVSSSSPPSIVLHNSTYYAATPRKPLLNLGSTSPTLASSGMIGSPSVIGNLKSPSPGFVLQQPASNMLHTTQTPIIPQTGMVSPLLNLQQGLVLQGGMQLASPLVNPIGLNLMQPGLQALQNPASPQVSAAQNLNLLQTAGTSAAVGSQLLNLNPLLLNTALASTAEGVLRQQLNQFGATIGSANMSTSLPRMGINTVVKPGFQQQAKTPLTTVLGQSTVVSAQNGARLVSPLPQMLQVPGSSLVIPTLGGANQQLNLLGQLAATPSSAQKQLVFQYPSSGQSVSTIASQLAQNTSTATKHFVSPANKHFLNDQGRAVTSIAGAAQNMRVKVMMPNAGQSVTKNDNVLNTTVAINQVTLAQKTSPTQQKLLLFSIGGQLVTGQGVPVSLSDGVLKVVPNGKIKINNQTLTPDQIKQTLAKINEAAAMTLNPVSMQHMIQTGHTGSNPATAQGKIIPVKIVKDSNSEAGPSSANMDHSYLHNSNEKVVASMVNGNSDRFTVSHVLTGMKSETDGHCISETVSVSPNFQTGLQVVNSDSMKFEPGQEVHFLDQSKDKILGVKPTVHSSGYVVRQPTANQEETDERPCSAPQSYNIGKLVMGKDSKRFVIKAPVKIDLNSCGDDSNCMVNYNSRMKTKTQVGVDDDDESEHKLVIDDDLNEKEAALNLLTLANQALAPMTGSMENNESNNTCS